MSTSKLQVLVPVLLALACLFHTAANGWLMQKSYGDKQQFNMNENDDQSDEFSQLADSMIVSVQAAASNMNSANTQCEPINIRMCSSMRYNFTRMKNFFGDASQIEAADRAKGYERLVQSRCSRHLLAYLCELIAPMCIDNDLQKKFEIYPCRPFCRQVKSDCSAAMLEMAGSYKLGHITTAFNCDLLPYESNGGNGSLQGPCHEMPDEGPKQVVGHNTASNYWPIAKDDEARVPPFVDVSLIDERIIRPNNPTRSEPKNLQPTTTTTTSTTAASSNFMTQLQSFGHQLALALLSYSNLLSVLTLICLLLVINTKRLKRLKSYLARRSSSSSSNRSSSSSSASSNDSRRKLAAVPALGQARKLALSPSSSSRSLVLVATTDGKRGQPKHKLVHANELATGSLEPSQRLLQAGMDRRTLINVNGTLERQTQQQNNAARYHLMQSLGSAEGANKHQYDYIQVLHQSSGRPGSEFEQQRPSMMGQQNYRPTTTNSSRPPPTNEPQMYSNILLSSPSHQVLLFGDGTGPDSQPPNRSHLMTATSLSSPYADPTFGAGGGSMSANRPPTHLMNGNDSVSLQQQLMAERQRSFQRRPSGSGNSASSRFKRTSNGALPAAYVSSGASSASSSAGSTTSSFSPPESSSGNLLLANQFVQSPRTGRSG